MLRLHCITKLSFSFIPFNKSYFYDIIRTQSKCIPWKKFQYNSNSSKSINKKVTMFGHHPIQTNSNNKEKELSKNEGHPLNRYWTNGCSSSRLKDNNSSIFTIMSYNILAQNLLTEHSYLYPDHNPDDLKWEKRWNNLFYEISQLAPDIMCLQEVEESFLKDYFNRFEALGYQGIYKKRTGIRLDGCAIYFRTDKFKLIEYETIEFYQPQVTILNRDNIAIVAKFQFNKYPNKEFVLATTHLLYNPKREDVRLAQVQLLITEIERLSFNHDKINRAKDPYLPVVITGDFNVCPDSAVYKFITNGLLQYNHLVLRSGQQSNANRQGNTLIPPQLGITDYCQHAALLNSRQQNTQINRIEESALIQLHNSNKNNASTVKTNQINIENSPLFGSGTISHMFAFKSVYNHGVTNNIEATTFQDKWVTVDYIFYSGRKDRCGRTIEDKIQLISKYRLPCENELKQICFPNAIYGSDHLNVMAKFNLI